MPIPIMRCGQGMELLETVFFVDLDGTLKTEAWESTGSITINLSKKYTFEPRPMAREFLIELKKLGDVYLCTASGYRYAKEVLKAMDIDDCFDGYYTKESYAHGIPSFPHIILIENSEELGRQKMDCVRKYPEPKIDLFVIPTYEGGEDNVLMNVLPTIRNLAKNSKNEES